MKFTLDSFYKFCDSLRVDTKEYGIVPLGKKLYAGQKYLIESIEAALRDEDIHTFVILKGRQLGITTISLALDLYWQFIHPGWQGTLVSDTEENREMFRSTLGMYHEHLPREFKIPLEGHNRNQMVLKNRSRLFYQVAGNRIRVSGYRLQVSG